MEPFSFECRQNKLCIIRNTIAWETGATEVKSNKIIRVVLPLPCSLIVILSCIKNGLMLKKAWIDAEKTKQRCNQSVKKKKERKIAAGCFSDVIRRTERSKQISQTMFIKKWSSILNSIIFHSLCLKVNSANLIGVRKI